MAEIGGADESTSGWDNERMRNEWVRIVQTRKRAKQMNKLFNKQVGDSCECVGARGCECPCACTCACAGK